MRLFIFKCVYEFEKEYHVARLFAPSLPVSSEGKARQGVTCWALKKQTRSRRLQGGEKNALHEVHMYMIG
jgi:hypothetical protein